MPSSYYADKLYADKLVQVYDTAIPRVRQYLDAEIDFVRTRLTGTETVLEIGAGYGRIIRQLAPHCASIMGIDIAEDSVEAGNEYLRDVPNASIIVMDIHNNSFDETFDVVLCLQNGLSAIQASLDTVHRIMALVAPGGRAYFSSYSTSFWDFRLQWFEEQAAKGLIADIDLYATGDHVIVCKDGFRSAIHTPRQFKHLGKVSGYPYRVREVDESSQFLIIHKAR